MSQTDTRTSLLAAVAAQAKAELAPLVQVIDQGHYPGEYMHHLGALGGFGAGIPAELGGQGLDLATQIEATTLVGQECGSTAFLVWCQSSCAWYLLHSPNRSEEHTSELQSLMRNSYAVFCLKKNTTTTLRHTSINN